MSCMLRRCFRVEVYNESEVQANSVKSRVKATYLEELQRIMIWRVFT